MKHGEGVKTVLKLELGLGLNCIGRGRVGVKLYREGEGWG